MQYYHNAERATTQWEAPPGWPAEAKHDATPTQTPPAATAVRSDDAAIVQAQQTSHGAGSNSRLAPESDSRGIAALGQEEEDATRLAARAKQEDRARAKENGVGIEIPPAMDTYEAPGGYDVDIILADQLPSPEASALRECDLVLAALIKSSAARPFVDMEKWLRPFLICATTTPFDRQAIGPLDLRSLLRKHRNTEHKGKFYKSAQQLREDALRVLRLASQVYGKGHELSRCAAAVASQFNEALAQRIAPPLHQGLTEAWTSSSHGAHWLGQRIRIYRSEDLSWHLATVDDCRFVGRNVQEDESASGRAWGKGARSGRQVGAQVEECWEYHMVCDDGWEGWMELSIDVCIVSPSMTSSPFEDVEVLSVGSVVYCEFQEEWIGQEGGAQQQVLNLSLSLMLPGAALYGGW